MNNPNWIRTAFASILLAVLLKEGFEIPIFSSLLVMGIIYLMNVVLTEMAAGASMAGRWIKFAGSMMIGIVIFLALRLIIGGALDLYPTETYREVTGAPGKLRGILFGHGSTAELRRILMFELIFSLVAGYLSAAWVNNKKRGLVGGIFVISLVVLIVQIGFPEYASTFPSRTKIDRELKTNGGITGTLKKMLPEKKTNTPPVSVSPAPSTRTMERFELVFEERTPCSTNISWPFRIERETGTPLQVRWPVSGGGFVTKTYSGADEAVAPTNMISGEVYFASPDKTNPRVSVWVYKRTVIVFER